MIKLDWKHCHICLTGSAHSQLEKEGPELTEIYRQLKITADSWQRVNAYSQVNLSKLFQGLFVLKQEKVRVWSCV